MLKKLLKRKASFWEIIEYIKKHHNMEAAYPEDLKLLTKEILKKEQAGAG